MAALIDSARPFIGISARYAWPGPAPPASPPALRCRYEPRRCAEVMLLAWDRSLQRGADDLYSPLCHGRQPLREVPLHHLQVEQGSHRRANGLGVLYRSTVPLPSSTPEAPTASALRIIVPRLLGSCIPSTTTTRPPCSLAFSRSCGRHDSFGTQRKQTAAFPYRCTWQAPLRLQALIRSPALRLLRAVPAAVTPLV